MKPQSAWDAHREAQKARIIERERARIAREQYDREEEAELRRRTRVFEYMSPLDHLVRRASKLRMRF
jgi:hypothetical protein